MQDEKEKGKPEGTPGKGPDEAPGQEKPKPGDPDYVKPGNGDDEEETPEQLPS